MRPALTHFFKPQGFDIKVNGFSGPLGINPLNLPVCREIKFPELMGFINKHEINAHVFKGDNVITLSNQRIKTLFGLFNHGLHFFYFHL